MPKTIVEKKEIELLRSWARRGDKYARLLLNIFDRDPQDVYSNATRPAANTVQTNTMIWNTDDNAPNWSDGTDWRDADGNLT